MGVVAYPNNFIAGVKTVLVLYDEDGDGDFDGHTQAVAAYIESGKDPQPWACGSVTLIPTVNPVVALVEITPPIELPGCLGRLFSVFFGRGTITTGSGSLTGNLQNPGGAARPRTKADVPFTVPNVTVYAGVTT